MVFNRFERFTFFKPPALPVVGDWPTEYTKEEALKARTATEHIRDVVKSALKPIISS
jgi:hypothetical protein